MYIGDCFHGILDNFIKDTFVCTKRYKVLVITNFTSVLLYNTSFTKKEYIKDYEKED